MSRFVLVRHAAVDTRGRYWGATDLPLSRAGQAQLPALARRLARERIEAIYASDLARARSTAAAIGPRLGCVVELDKRLRELDFGACEGLTFDEIRARWPDVAHSLMSDPTSLVAPGGESFAAFASRVREFTMEHLRTIDGDIVVVAHRGALAVIASAVLERPPGETLLWDFPPAGVKVLVVGAGRSSETGARHGRHAFGRSDGAG